MKKKFYNVEDENILINLVWILPIILLISLMGLGIKQAHDNAKKEKQAETEFDKEMRETENNLNEIEKNVAWLEGFNRGLEKGITISNASLIHQHITGVHKGIIMGSEAMLECIEENGIKDCKNRLENLKKENE